MIKNFIALIGVLSLYCLSCSHGEYVTDSAGNVRYVAPGVGLGTIIAVVVSWTRNKSIGWAIVHGILGWFYVIYAILVRNPNK